MSRFGPVTATGSTATIGYVTTSTGPSTASQQQLEWDDWYQAIQRCSFLGAADVQDMISKHPRPLPGAI